MIITLMSVWLTYKLNLTLMNTIPKNRIEKEI